MPLTKIKDIPTEVLQTVSTEQAWHYQIIPFHISESELHCYAHEHKWEHIEEELELLFGRQIHLTPTAGTLFREYLGKYYRQNETVRTKTAALNITDKDFLDKLIHEARALEGSDIHLEPYEKNCRIRFRIDGIMLERYQLPKENYPSIVNKIKIKANLDIAEKRLPQDGRIFVMGQAQKFDIRVSTLPTLHGEKIVLRLLSGDDTNIDIRQLGFQEIDLRPYLESVKRPNGMVLISGPTGSGKTTTLYATLSLLNQTERNILTIEDPIEYTLEGINQVQLKESIGLNFASAMRTFLRQDPDIIMVGEIRDVETASMAIRASLTGHLVLSTIHTNRAWGIVARLIDMGIPPYLLADTLNAAVAQRLVRVLCKHCKECVDFDKASLPEHYLMPASLKKQYVAVGCEHCHYTGHRGRRAVYEVIPIDTMLSECIKEKDLNVSAILKTKGIQSLADNAFRLFAEGETSAKEIYPILASTR